MHTPVENIMIKLKAGQTGGFMDYNHYVKSITIDKRKYKFLPNTKIGPIIFERIQIASLMFKDHDPELNNPSVYAKGLKTAMKFIQANHHRLEK